MVLAHSINTNPNTNTNTNNTSTTSSTTTIPNDSKILCINFNQDQGCFAISHEQGFWFIILILSNYESNEISSSIVILLHPGQIIAMAAIVITIIVIIVQAVMDLFHHWDPIMKQLWVINRPINPHPDQDQDQDQGLVIYLCYIEQIILH